MNYDPAPVMRADCAARISLPSSHMGDICPHLVLETAGHTCCDKLRRKEMRMSTRENPESKLGRGMLHNPLGAIFEMHAIIS